MKRHIGWGLRGSQAKMFPVLRMHDPPGTSKSITNVEAHQSFRYPVFIGVLWHKFDWLNHWPCDYTQFWVPLPLLRSRSYKCVTHSLNPLSDHTVGPSGIVAPILRLSGDSPGVTSIAYILVWSEGLTMNNKDTFFQFGNTKDLEAPS